MDDDPTDAGVWMTKAELAKVRRITPASADRLIRRQRWQKQPGNDGRARVLVPPDWTNPPPTDKPDRPQNDPTDIRRAINLLEVALNAAFLRADKAEQRAEQAEAKVTAVEAGREHAEAEAD